MILELLGKNIYVYVTPFLGGVKENKQHKFMAF